MCLRSLGHGFGGHVLMVFNFYSRQIRKMIRHIAFQELEDG